MKALEQLLSVDVPALLRLIPEEQGQSGGKVVPAAVAQVGGSPSPFAVMKVDLGKL